MKDISLPIPDNITRIFVVELLKNSMTEQDSYRRTIILKHWLCIYTAVRINNIIEASQIESVRTKYSIKSIARITLLFNLFTILPRELFRYTTFLDLNFRHLNFRHRQQSRSDPVALVIVYQVCLTIPVNARVSLSRGCQVTERQVLSLMIQVCINTRQQVVRHAHDDLRRLFIHRILLLPE